ncbi:hypothetical protein DFH09DRAFT_1360668 [Mycena vulgaris]|nr:hypothetical protein DFH09DRAFT_1360668 [Mycena vulgaris]
MSPVRFGLGLPCPHNSRVCLRAYGGALLFADAISHDDHDLLTSTCTPFLRHAALTDDDCLAHHPSIAHRLPRSEYALGLDAENFAALLQNVDGTAINYSILPTGETGLCGVFYENADLVVAIPRIDFQQGHCGETIAVEYNIVQTLTILDICESCVAPEIAMTTGCAAPLVPPRTKAPLRLLARRIDLLLLKETRLRLLRIEAFS